MLDALLSAAAVTGSDRPLDCTALSTTGLGCLSRAAAVEALVRGAIVENSLQNLKKWTFVTRTTNHNNNFHPLSTN